MDYRATISSTRWKAWHSWRQKTCAVIEQMCGECSCFLFRLKITPWKQDRRFSSLKSWWENLVGLRRRMVQLYHRSSSSGGRMGGLWGGCCEGRKEAGWAEKRPSPSSPQSPSRYRRRTCKPGLWSLALRSVSLFFGVSTRVSLPPFSPQSLTVLSSSDSETLPRFEACDALAPDDQPS